MESALLQLMTPRPGQFRFFLRRGVVVALATRSLQVAVLAGFVVVRALCSPSDAQGAVIIPDESGNGIDATFEGDPQFAMECVGQALLVDGEINPGTAPATGTAGLQALTVEGYVRWNGNTNDVSAGRLIIDKMSPDTDAGRSWAVGILKDSRQLNGVVWFNAVNGRVDVVDPDPLPDPMTECVHIALTVSENGEVRLYRNGQLKASESFAGKSVNYAADSPLHFANGNTTSPLEGAFDVFRISNIVRTSFPTAPEVLSVDANTVALWRFGEECPPSSVSGYVRDSLGNGVAGVQINKGCDVGGFTMTDANGYWEVNNISDPFCTFTPSLAGYSFSPPSQTIFGCEMDVDFTAAEANVVIADESGNGLDIIFSGTPQLAPECVGQALQIDGAVNYGTVPASPLLLLQELTVEGFVRWDGNQDGASVGRGIIDKIEQSSDVGRNWAVGILKDTRQLTGVVWYDANNGRIDLVDPDPLPDPMTECIHVALTVAAGGEVRLYRDGQLKASASFTGRSINYAVNSPIGFGDSSNRSSPLEGSLDVFRISNIVRTSFPSSPQVLSVDANTVALWRFGPDCPPSSVSGYVRDGSGNGLAGVQIDKGCDVGGFTTTDANGYWEVNNISDAFCTFTPTLAGYSFFPPTRTVFGCQSSADFTACTGEAPYSVSGFVLDGAGLGVPGVQVDKGCDVGGFTTTDANGYWEVNDITDPTCTFTPDLAGYTFTPPSRTISGCARDVRFTACSGAPEYSASGHVRDGQGIGVTGVQINKGCDVGGFTTTDANGYWVVNNISAANCTFTPMLPGHEIFPASRTVTTCASGVDFTVCTPSAPYSVSGYVRDGQGEGIAGVQVNKGCDVGGYAITDANGYWEVNNITAASCTFTPDLAGYTMFPPSRTINGCARDADFTACTGAAPYSVSGYIRDSQGVGVPGVQVNKGCDAGGYTLTDATGYWAIHNISASSCVFTPTKSGYAFGPPATTVSGCARDVEILAFVEATDVPVAGESDAGPSVAFLDPPTPEPFTDRTRIRFGIPLESRVRVDVFDVTGRAVGVVLDERRSRGFHEVEWLPLGPDGSRLASGVYFCRLTVDGHESIRRMTLMR